MTIQLINTVALCSLSLLFIACENDKLSTENKDLIPTYDLGLYTVPSVRSEYLDFLQVRKISFDVIEGPLLRVPINQLAKVKELNRQFTVNNIIKRDDLNPYYTEILYIKGHYSSELKKIDRYKSALTSASIPNVEFEKIGGGSRGGDSELWLIKYSSIYIPAVDKIHQAIELEAWKIADTIDNKH